MYEAKDRMRMCNYSPLGLDGLLNLGSGLGVEDWIGLEGDVAGAELGEEDVVVVEVSLADGLGLVSFCSTRKFLS